MSNRIPVVVRLVTLAFFASLSSSLVRAQCDPFWLPVGGISGTNGDVFDTVAWDPDGAGPLPERLVICGQFNTVAGLSVSGLAAWDQTIGEWSTVGTNLVGTKRKLAVAANGDLIVVGSQLVASTALGNVARWNGTAWSSMGFGTSGQIEEVQVLPGGALVVGGPFTAAGGVPAAQLARWDGAQWSELGGGVPFGAVGAFAIDANGDLLVGGSFVTLGGVTVNGLARWDGAAWNAFGGGFDIFASNGVHSLMVMPNGDIVAGGLFAFADGLGVHNIARWNGSSWSPMGSGFDASFSGSVHDMVVLTNGDLVVGGAFSRSGSVPMYCVARWNGVAWSAIGTGFPASGVVSKTVYTLTELSGGDLYAGGTFVSANGQAGDRVSRWDGANWLALGPGMSDTAATVAVEDSGSVVVGGAFQAVGGVSAAAVARFDGVSWSSFGAGLSGNVNALLPLPGGELIAGGLFTVVGSVPSVNNIARWDGSAWRAMGSGVNSRVTSLVRLPDGDVVAAGSFSLAGGAPANRIARWNGTSWSPFGGGFNSNVSTLLLLADGSLLAGGAFTQVDGVAAPNVARWDGVVWTPFGNGVSNVNRLMQTPDGEIFVGTGNSLRRYDAVGDQWQYELSAGTNAWAVLPGGDLVIGGGFTSVNGAPAGYLARRRAGVWEPFGPGTACDFTVLGLAVTQDGDVVVVGSFLRVDGMPSARFARVRSGCVADVEDLGGGCVGASGSSQLHADSLPWNGTGFAVSASGLSPITIAALVTGFDAAAVPLDAVIAEALPGCTLQTTIDLVGLFVTTDGTMHGVTAIPPSPLLVGRTYRQQLVCFGLDAGLAVVEVTASNALQGTIGRF